MKVLHVISGGETGGSRKHVITLLEQFEPSEVTLAVFQEGALAEEARAAGIRTELFAQTSRYDLSVLKRLAAFIQAEQFDILHTHGPRANLFGIYMKKKTGIRWVTTVHSDPALDFVKGGVKGTIFTKLSLYAIRQMDHYFAVSDRFKQNLVSLGIRPEKVQTVYNGVHFTEEPAAAVPLPVPEQAFVIAMVARLHPIKGHEIVFEALRQSEVKPHVLLIGDGPIEDELREKAKDLSEYVHFLGFRKDVAGIYAASDVALLASYSESFPLALLEAANERIPLISTDVGGVGELITPEETGWIIPAGDASALAAAIKEAMQADVKGMGEKLYEHASSNFSLDQLHQTTKEVYKKIASR
ncbi:glycosyltransferase family 4 protein [Domibacillus epiphyticus]|uniref:Glycosyltransferase n=1 Tax=Domibacillus epiphyticus TaxID=1714355 RepID=A0A1V2A6I6_9BACI|nr:glycosyltransferase family 4 protein [Domibacillus epiphyticus]OMP66623.1 glycosyltransferase [Domibacillus epiphyticus]